MSAKLGAELGELIGPKIQRPLSGDFVICIMPKIKTSRTNKSSSHKKFVTFHSKAAGSEDFWEYNSGFQST